LAIDKCSHFLQNAEHLITDAALAGDFETADFFLVDDAVANAQQLSFHGWVGMLERIQAQTTMNS